MSFEYEYENFEDSTEFKEGDDGQYVMFADDEPETTFSEEKLVKGGVIGGTLNLRAEPSKAARVLLTLPTGTILSIKEPVKGDKWFRVLTEDGIDGWVMSEFVKWDE